MHVRPYCRRDVTFSSGRREDRKEIVGEAGFKPEEAKRKAGSIGSDGLTLPKRDVGSPAYADML